MPASWSVAKSAMEAPTGPDDVRPCAWTGTGAGIATPTSKKRNSHAPARCMRDYTEGKWGAPACDP